MVGADDGGSEAHVGHVGVNLGGRDAAVAEEFLDVADVDAGLDELRRGAVPQHVGRHAAADRRGTGEFVEPAAEVVRPCRRSARSDEKGVR